MKKLRVLDLFSGIGGFSLGLDRAGGFETVAFCEIEPFPRRVLAKHWPEVPCYDDVTKLTGDILERDGITGIDVITGGFPCQDISVAGKQAGLGEGTRSGLWSEIVRLIGELAPRYVIVENVAALLSGPSEQRGGWFGSILGDLAECGYDAEWENIPAASVGAPHRRERVWLVAYPVKTGRPNRSIFGSCGEWVARTHANNLVSSWPSADSWKERTEGRKPQEVSGLAAFSWRQDVRGVEDYFRLPNIPQPLVFRNSDGLPNALDRVGCCGNAVVPQIPELIGRAIMEAEGMT
jgi:DNA (cytosine-5)-methyltransferase 1